MATNKIKFNSKGFRQILVGPGVSAVVASQAFRIANRAGKGVVARTITGNYGGGRTVGFAQTTAKTPEDAERQREALEAAVHGG